MEPDWQVFWRITFDVIDGVIRLQQELTWWEMRHEANEWVFTRRDRVVEDLPYTLQGAVTIERDRAVFRGGYLEGQTLDLLAYVQKRLGPAANLSGLTSLSLGESIAIRADVKLHPLGDGEYPVFYLSQPDAPPGVRLLEVVRGGQRRWIEWHISNQALHSPEPFRIAHFDDWHALRVRQDEDTAAGHQVYEFLVDSIALGNEKADPGVHKFDTGPMTFYIGATPDHLGGLHGEITHLDFDPSDSCVRCRKRVNQDEQPPVG